MIERSKLQFLDTLMQSTQTVLNQYESLAKIATETLARAEVYMKQDTADPKEVLDMFRRVHDMQMQTLSTLNATLERFPVEHTIQELQMLELFRNLNEQQKKQFMTQLEIILIDKKKKR